MKLLILNNVNIEKLHILVISYAGSCFCIHGILFLIHHLQMAYQMHIFQCEDLAPTLFLEYISNISMGYSLHHTKLDVTHPLPLSTFKNVLYSSGKIPDLLRLDFRPIFHKFLTIDKKRQVLEPDKIIHYITAIYLFCGQENVSFPSLLSVYFQKQDFHKMFFD